MKVLRVLSSVLIVGCMMVHGVIGASQVSTRRKQTDHKTEVASHPEQYSPCGQPIIIHDVHMMRFDQAGKLLAIATRPVQIV